MFLSFIKVFNIILLSIFLIAFSLIFIAMIRTVLFKHNKIKVLEKTSLSSGKINEYQKNFEHLFGNEINVAIENLFPTFYSKCEKVEFSHGTLFKYRNNQIETTNILIDIPIENNSPNEIKFTTTSAYGKNTYKSKSLLYSVFDSLETLLIKEKKLDLNISICVYEKEYTNNDMVGHLFEAGEKFDFAIGEGGNILDPVTTGYSSFYAFVGVGLNEKATIRYKTKKIGKGQERIVDFIKELKSDNIFEMKIAPESVSTIKNISKCMLYGNRFILNNISWLPTLGKRIVEEELVELNKAWKTWVNINEPVEDEDWFYVDVDFYISNSETVSDIISILNKKTIKYSLEYEILEKDEKSRTLSSHDHYYRKFISIVESAFQELYTMPYTLNENISDRNIEKISEIVVRLNPIYYSRDAIIGRETDNEWVSFSSIDKAINFYEELFLNLRRK